MPNVIRGAARATALLPHEKIAKDAAGLALFFTFMNEVELVLSSGLFLTTIARPRETGDFPFACVRMRAQHANNFLDTPQAGAAPEDLGNSANRRYIA
jgi:hypothetical protein